MASYEDLVTGFLKDARALVQESTFPRQCIDRLLDTRVTPNASAIGFVDGLGHAANGALNDLTTREDIWGINYATCRSSCYYTDLPFPFDYSTFSSAMTNYLLPWLALTAQLPYETGSFTANLMALCLALGSPVLITYSLSLTVIHSYKLKHTFDRLKGLKDIPPSYSEHLSTIQDVLQAAQHVPLRASQYRGWLSSLLILKENDDWWKEVRKYLMGRVRDFSPSALAQIGVAVVAWLLTIVAALSTKLGDTDTGLQIASGSLWIWLVPVVVGYIRVGVPNSDLATPEAFARPGARRAGPTAAQPGTPNASPIAERSPRPSLRPGPSTDAALPGTSGGSHTRQPSSSHSPGSAGRTRPPSEDIPLEPVNTALRLAVPGAADPRVDSANNLPEEDVDARFDDNYTRGIRTSGGLFSATDDTIFESPKAMGLPIIGDANTRGAAYTYARSLEFPFFTQLLTDALEQAIKNDPHRDQAAAVQSSTEATIRLCGPNWQANMRLNPFPRLSQVTADWWHRMIVAAMVALFVQWGTTMASFILAFLTPVKGLGCRSGSYILYGTASTVAWLLLVAAQICSNEAMRIHQERTWQPEGSVRPMPQAPLPNAPGDAPADSPGDTPDNAGGLQPRARRQSTVQVEADDRGTHDSDKKLLIFGYAAVACRVTGKVLCVLNALWLLLTSIAEIIGGFENCWCLANRPSAGRDSWIVLFKTSEDLASQANSSWGGGLAITIFVSIIAILFFAIGSPRHKGS